MYTHKHACIGLVLALILISKADAQDNRDDRLFVKGYFKTLQTMILQPDEPILTDQLLHSRATLRYDLAEAVRFNAALRSRLFWGDQVQILPFYGDLIDMEANDVVDLSLLLEDEGNIMFHSYFDRLYLEYVPKNWEVRLGRQRINWGINNYWNPNDIFNTFSFVDFDYEERPGSDALRIKHYTGIASSIELAVKAFEDIDDIVAAMLWKHNFSEYDVQVLAGWYKEHFTLGGGWAGNLGNAGFKGEVSFFVPTDTDADGQEFAVSAATQADYVFDIGLYGTAGVLYNSSGATDGSLSQIFNFELDARHLYPFRFAVLLSGAYTVSPLSSVNATLVYSPVSSHPVFFSPAYSYSIAQNWDLDFVGQIVFNKEEGRYRSPVQALFLRIKWSW